MRGADAGELAHDVCFGEQGVDDAIAEFRPIVCTDVLDAEDRVDDRAHGRGNDVHCGGTKEGDECPSRRFIDTDEDTCEPGTGARTDGARGVEVDSVAEGCSARGGFFWGGRAPGVSDFAVVT